MAGVSKVLSEDNESQLL